MHTVERFFGDLTTRRVRVSFCRRVAEHETITREYVRHHNTQPNPVVWTVKAACILARVVRAQAALVKS